MSLTDSVSTPALDRNRLPSPHLLPVLAEAGVVDAGGKGYLTFAEGMLRYFRGETSGAAPTTAMTHIAIQEYLEGKAVEWLEQVSDEQYQTGD